MYRIKEHLLHRSRYTLFAKKLDINNSLTFQEQFGLMNSQREKKLLSSNDEKSVIDDNKKKKRNARMPFNHGRRRL